MATDRLLLPTDHYYGARGSGTIKAIAAGTFQTADDRLMQSGAGSPVGSVTGQWVGQRYLDTTNGGVWFCTATDAYNWVQLQNGELVAFENASVFCDNEAVTA
jgi:hypothetical protein